jgi:hypothetical protein
MGQEFIIKSQDLEDKINQLLPSQGGFQAGVDLSASTTIIPIVDLTESAEGSDVRADLQTALSFSSVTAHAVQNQTSTIINTTGYFRVFGACSFESNTTSSVQGLFNLTDGASTKKIVDFVGIGGTASNFVNSYDFIVFLKAGDSLTCQSTANDCVVRGCSRQIADISGNLVNPT